MSLTDTYEFYKNCCSGFFESFKMFENKDILLETIRTYCDNPNQSTSQDIYSAYLTTYRMSGLNELITQMHKYEVLSSQLIAKHRDHFEHAINVFLLGISVYQSNSSLRQAINDMLGYADKYPAIEEEFLFRWGMSALFHDVGYPLEIAYETIKEFATKLINPCLILKDDAIQSSNNRIFTQEPIAVLNFPNLNDIIHINFLNPKEEFAVSYYDKYPELKDNLPDNSLLAIAKIISEMGFASPDNIFNKIKESITKGLENGLVDHGIYSSIVFLKWTNKAYSEANWNPAYYYYPIVNSAAAIFLHNTYEYLFRTPPYSLPPLNVNSNPLAFLLILCDRTQETNRKSYGYKDRRIEFSQSELVISDDIFNLTLFVSPDDNNLAMLEADKIEENVKKIIEINSTFQELRIIIKN